MADHDEDWSDGSPVPQQSRTSTEDVITAELVARDAVQDAVRLLLGAAGLAVLAARELLEISTRADETTPALVANYRTVPLPRPGATIWRAAHLAVGLGVATQRRCLDAVSTVSGPVATVASALMETAATRGPLAAGARALGRLSEDGLVEQRRNQEVALASGQALVRAVITAVLAEVDIDAVAARLDLDAVVARLDLDAVVARLDLDAVAAGLDVNAVVQRVDLARVTEQVLEEVDVAHIVRESSGAIAAETVDAVRIQGMRADGFLSRAVDRVLQRNAARNTSPSLPPVAPVDHR